MKYHVRLSRQMRNLQIMLMICVIIAGLAGAIYCVLATGAGVWKFRKSIGYMIALVVLLIALVIAWNGYCEITTRVTVYPGRKIIVHKGTSVKSYRFDQLRKPKKARSRYAESYDYEEDKDPYGFSMVVRLKNGREIVKLSTSYKYVRRLEADLFRYLE